MGHIRIPHGAAQDPYPGCCPYHTTAIACRAFGCRRPRPKAKRRELPFYGEMEHWLRRQHERCPEGCQWEFFHNSRPVGANCEDGVKPAKPLASRPFSFTASAERQYATCASPRSTKVCGSRSPGTRPPAWKRDTT